MGAEDCPEGKTGVPLKWTFSMGVEGNQTNGGWREVIFEDSPGEEAGQGGREEEGKPI